MGNLFRVLKVNIYSILALPFLIIATISKMIAKALGKISVILTMAIITGAAVIVVQIARDPSGIISHMGMTTAIFVGLGIIIAFLRLVFSVVRFVLITIYHAVIRLFETIYELSFSVYSSLYNGCTNDFKYLSLTGPSFIYGVLCVFYVILCFVNLLIRGFIHISLLLMIAFSAGFAGFIYFDVSSKVRETFGLELMDYLGRFDTVSLVGSTGLYFLLVIDVFVIFVSLGVEWKRWSDELSFNEDDLDRLMDHFEDNDEDIDEYLEDDEIDEVLYEYISVVNEHLELIEDFMDEVKGAIELQKNELLENSCNEYLRNLSDVSDELAQSRGNLSEQDVSRLKPLIRKLDRQRDNIRKMIEKQAEILDNPARNSMFFVGCNTREKLDKRYKSLCRAYHPDSEGGDEETFKALNAEYTKLKKLMEIGQEY